MVSAAAANFPEARTRRLVWGEAFKQRYIVNPLGPSLTATRVCSRADFGYLRAAAEAGRANLWLRKVEVFSASPSNPLTEAARPWRRRGIGASGCGWPFGAKRVQKRSKAVKRPQIGVNKLLQ